MRFNWDASGACLLIPLYCTLIAAVKTQEYISELPDWRVFSCDWAILSTVNQRITVKNFATGGFDGSGRPARHLPRPLCLSDLQCKESFVRLAETRVN